MPTYFLKLTHSSDQCPTSSLKVRERVLGTAGDIPKLAEQLGVKMVVGPLVLGSEHESVALVEADRVETVNDFIQMSGLIQWNSVRVSMAEPLQEALARMEKIPPAIY